MRYSRFDEKQGLYEVFGDELGRPLNADLPVPSLSADVNGIGVPARFAGRPLPADLVESLESCFARSPEHGGMLHVGVMLGRPEQVVRLSLLSPGIVEAIVDGREPSGLSLEMLVNGMPVVWGEQRERFDMPQR